MLPFTYLRLMPFRAINMLHTSTSLTLVESDGPPFILWYYFVHSCRYILGIVS